MSDRRFLYMALRNLGRNKRRTFLTATAIVFGVVAVVFLEGWVDGFYRYLIENSVLAKFGAITVFKKDYFVAEDPLRLGLPDSSEFAARLLAVPGVTAVAPRIRFDGLVSNGAVAAMFIATAIDEGRESQVCPKRAPIPSSQRPPPSPAGDVAGRALLGKTLTLSLGAEIGATLIMQAHGSAGRTNALDVVVSGFLPHGSFAESKRLATVPLPFAQRLLHLEGQVTEYAAAVRSLDEIDEVADRLHRELGPSYEVRTWRELDPATELRASTLRQLLRLVSVVLFLLVGAGIANAMMMSVYERVREIGTMLSLGARRRQVAALFLCEAGTLGLLSALPGIALGAAVVRVLGWHGILRHLTGGEIIVLRPHVGFGFLALVLILTILGAMLATLYPAWQAARLRPAVALRRAN